ncbi:MULTISPECIES: endonuclease V [Streptomyces]|uniref:endonuclease V n=1 Tax=Streptomyces TaxID=1883 RepID=UPI0019062235|nr:MULTISPECIES: endonuclease V [unclassified Streptomyces]MCU4746074.1 endonuclease V [Streptomyces sp. G-5]QQN76403.1 endonuclease V [Streptomyces sp. XC 2026]
MHLHHTTPATEDEAIARQLTLRERVSHEDSGPAPGAPATVAGVDVAYDDERGIVAAAAVTLDARTLEVRERATATGPVAFPYRPGLLAYRELPAVLDALGRLATPPDLVVCDGYGTAHPRRFGLAAHLGVLTGLPTIGVAKNPFTFRHRPPGPERGAWSPLVDDAEGPQEADGPAGARGTELACHDEEVGRALRTQPGVKPVYVSTGHRVSLPTACAHVLNLARRYRLPETTRAADQLCRAALKAATAHPGGTAQR